MTDGAAGLYAVFAEAQGYDKPLVQLGLPFGRLIDDVVLPYESDRPFFVDGAPIQRKDVTSQVIQVFDRTIRPSLKDYLPKREELIAAATKVFLESVRVLGGG